MKPGSARAPLRKILPPRASQPASRLCPHPGKTSPKNKAHTCIQVAFWREYGAQVSCPARGALSLRFDPRLCSPTQVREQLIRDVVPRREGSASSSSSSLVGSSSCPGRRTRRRFVRRRRCATTASRRLPAVSRRQFFGGDVTTSAVVGGGVQARTALLPPRACRSSSFLLLQLFLAVEHKVFDVDQLLWRAGPRAVREPEGDRLVVLGQPRRERIAQQAQPLESTRLQIKRPRRGKKSAGCFLTIKSKDGKRTHQNCFLDSKVCLADLLPPLMPITALPRLETNALHVPLDEFD